MDTLLLTIPQIFKNNIPYIPINHIAECQNPVDFELTNKHTLSVKTNKKKLGKVAPQIIGQPTSSTYFRYFKDLIDEEIPDKYLERSLLFKQFSINNIDKVINRYWNYLFHRDYISYFYNILDL